MPAPSPVSGSQPQAPRCAKLTRISKPLSTISCEGRPAIFATKPIPHASCSFEGSYSPCDAGTWLLCSIVYTFSPHLGLRGIAKVYLPGYYSSNRICVSLQLENLML